MIKCKFFWSLFKERDWLEEMAAQGWLLENLTVGIFYHFKQIEPSQKVYEIDRFSLSANPKKEELTARQMAFDIAKESGWEVATHDEDMNYYFVKDKAGDESDEFYDDENIRQERADKYRRHYAIDQPKMLLTMWLAVSALYVAIFLLFGNDRNFTQGLMWFYIVLTIFEMVMILSLIVSGEAMYKELLLTRQEWDHRKQYAQKKQFGKAESLLAFLKEQSQKGLELIDCENGEYLFEEIHERYEYCIDTKKALIKRLKDRGVSYQPDKKDWNMQSTKWYEMSIQEATENGMDLVCVAQDGTLIYRRKYQPEKQQWVSGAVYTESAQKMIDGLKFGTLIIVAAFLLGLCIGALVSALF